jgi:hypothetical protein
MANNVSSLASDVLVTPESCKRCEELQKVVANMAHSITARIQVIAEQSGMDLSLCRGCSQWVICVPDGLALCKRCAEKAGE